MTAHAIYWAVPCSTCGGMIALALTKFDEKQKAIDPARKEPFEVECFLCRTPKIYAMYQVLMWQGPPPSPAFRPHPAFR